MKKSKKFVPLKTKPYFAIHIYSGEGQELAQCLANNNGSIPAALREMASNFIENSLFCKAIAVEFENAIAAGEEFSVETRGCIIKIEGDPRILKRMEKGGLLANTPWVTLREVDADDSAENDGTDEPASTRVDISEYFGYDEWPTVTAPDGTEEYFTFGNFDYQGVEFGRHLKKCKGDLPRTLRAWADSMWKHVALYTNMADRIEAEESKGYKFRFYCMHEFSLLEGDERILNTLAEAGFLYKNIEEY